MANAKPDENSVFSKLAVLNTDTVQGTNLVRIQVDETNFNSLKINAVATISFTMQPVSPKDENYRNCLLFKGSDGFTYPWVATASGEVLISI